MNAFHSAVPALALGLALPAAASLGSSSGRVEVGLPRGFEATLDLSSARGDLGRDVPMTLLSCDRRSLHARIGRGGPAVRLSSSSGDVHVTSGGS